MTLHSDNGDNLQAIEPFKVDLNHMVCPRRVLARLPSANMFGRSTRGFSSLQRRKPSWWSCGRAPATPSPTARRPWRNLTTTYHRCAKPTASASEDGTEPRTSSCVVLLACLATVVSVGNSSVRLRTFCLSSHWLPHFRSHTMVLNIVCKNPKQFFLVDIQWPGWQSQSWESVMYKVLVTQTWAKVLY